MFIKNLFNSFSKKIYLIFFIFSLLVITFLSSYYITHYFINPSFRVEDSKKEKTVYNDNSNNLKEDILVTLITGENIDYSTTLKNIKKNLNLTENLTLESLTKFLSEKNYLLSKWDESSLTYIREEEKVESNFLPNKYYLGEKDGYISMFKTDDKGLIIESEFKVYSDYNPINFLPKSDQELIINNKFFYDSREDALMKLSEMVS